MRHRTEQKEQSLAIQLAAALRQQVMSGRLMPGTRLPGRQELARLHDVSLETAHTAVQLLTRQGFLHVGPRRLGTTVSEQPPHLFHYKLLFPHGRDDRDEFSRAMQAQALRMNEENRCKYSFFFNEGMPLGIEAYNEVVADVRSECVAGLIFTSGATEFKGTPVLEQPGIPRVALAAHDELPGIPKIDRAYESFFERSLDLFLAQGRRRIAALFRSSGNDERNFLWVFHEECMRRRGLSVNPLWIQFADINSPLSARNCVRLLLHPGQEERPDGLLVTDDNFLTSAALGVLDSGVDAERDLTVVSIANFPAAVPSAVPVARIGYDVRDILLTLTSWVDLLRAGGNPPGMVVIPARLESELEPVQPR